MNPEDLKGMYNNITSKTLVLVTDLSIRVFTLGQPPQTLFYRTIVAGCS